MNVKIKIKNKLISNNKFSLWDLKWKKQNQKNKDEKTNTLSTWIGG